MTETSNIELKYFKKNNSDRKIVFDKRKVASLLKTFYRNGSPHHGAAKGDKKWNYLFFKKVVFLWAKPHSIIESKTERIFLPDSVILYSIRTGVES